MKNVVDFESKKMEKERTVRTSLKDIAELAANRLFVDIMTMHEDTIEAYLVLQEIAIKNDSIQVPYTEFLENLPPEEHQYAKGHLLFLEGNRLILTEVMTEEDGSEKLYIHLGWE